MNPHSAATVTLSGLPGADPGQDVFYSLEVIAELAGVDVVTVLRYQEMGMIPSVARCPVPERPFDDEALRRLRRIKHLQDACGINETGIEMIMTLLDEVEVLRQERRNWRP